MRKIAIAAAVGVSAALFGFGCTAEVHGPEVGVGVGVNADVEASGPVIDAPGVLAIDVDPPIEERQYVYDPGFPPGVYLYGGFYYYGGYRYPHDAFVTQYVQENIRRGRFNDPNENRRQGVQIQQRQREEYTRTGGKHVQPADRNQAIQKDRAATPDRANMTAEQRAAEDKQRTEQERQRTQQEKPAVHPEEKNVTPREEHPAAKPEEKTTTPREEHPAARPEDRKTEPKPGEQPAKPGEKEKPEDRADQK